MVALPVGPTGAVRGRLPHGWRIAACFKRETGIVDITSPDTDRFSLNVDTSKLDEYSATHKPTLGVLEDACVEAKYEHGVLRYDAAEVSEFWLEVHIQQIMKSKKSKVKPTSKKAKFPDPFKDLDEETLDDCIEELYGAESLEDLEGELKHGYNCTKVQAVYWLKKKYMTTTSYGEDLYHRLTSETTTTTEPMMPWSKMTVDDAVLTLWPGTSVKESDLAGPEGVMAFFKEAFDIEPTPVGCVETLPDTDADGVEIEGTGGRHDFFFYVKMADVPKFAIKRFEFDMRWWEDVYFNNGEFIYPIEFRQAYPKA